MFRSSPESVPDRFEPAVGAPIAEPMMPYLIVMFGLRTCRYESFPFDVQLPRIEAGRILVPADEPGIAPWSGEAGIELPVRYGDLTLGRYVLVPASPTTGVGFSVTIRDEAMELAAGVGARIGAELAAGREDQAGRTPATPIADVHARDARHLRRPVRGRRDLT